MIHCIGDSHGCIFTGRGTREQRYMCPAWPEKGPQYIEGMRGYRIGPATAYNLESKKPILTEILSSEVDKDHDNVLFVFGEVDTRAHLIKQQQLQGRSIEDLVSECLDRYFKVILFYKGEGYKMAAWGPMASAPDILNYCGPKYGTSIDRNRVSLIFNKGLEERCLAHGLKFASIYHEMLLPNGDTDPSLFMDDIHLSEVALPLIIKALKSKDLYFD